MSNRKSKTETRKSTAPQHAEPPVQTQPPAVQSQGAPDRRFWPPDQPLPAVWLKLQMRANPCPKCRRVLMDHGGQAVQCLSSGPELAWFRCKACSHVFKLPVHTVAER